MCWHKDATLSPRCERSCCVNACAEAGAHSFHSSRCFADKMHPSSRHGGKGWLPSDVRRESLYGRPLNARDAVFFIGVLNLQDLDENQAGEYSAACDPSEQKLLLTATSDKVTAEGGRVPCLFWVCKRWTRWSKAARCQTWETSFPVDESFLATSERDHLHVIAAHCAIQTWASIEPCVSLIVDLRGKIWV